MPGLLTLFTSNQTKHEIARAQRELHLRKKLVIARRRILVTHAKQALASKKALATAGAAGFMIGQLSKTPKPKEGDNHHKADLSDILKKGLRIYTLSQTAASLAGFLGLE